MSTLVTGARKAAILIWSGPVQMAWGMISPKIRTAMTDINIATAAGTIASIINIYIYIYIYELVIPKNIGRASRANALASKRVTNSQWCS